MVTRKVAAPAKKAVSARPVAKKAAAPAPARKAVAARPVAKKAAAAPTKAASGATEARKAQLAEARAKRGSKPAPVAEAPKHPVNKEKIQAHDVARSFHTFMSVYAAWLAQEGEEIAAVLNFVAPILPVPEGAPAKTPLTRAKVSEAEREEDEKYYDREKIEKYSIKDLRELATDLAAQGIITETKVKKTILEEMEEAGLFREGEDSSPDEDDEIDGEDAEEIDDDEDEEDDESDDDDESEDDTETAVFTREELAGYKLKQLQEIAEANEIEWEGLSKSELIDVLVPEDEEEDEAEEEDDEDEEGEEEEGGYITIDPAALKKASIEELLEICDQAGYDVPRTKRKNKAAIIEIILENVEGDEDEEEEEDDEE